MVSLSRSKYYQAVNISIYIVAAAETIFVVLTQISTHFQWQLKSLSHSSLIAV